MVYRRDIDGLRAVAVMSVIFFHAGFDLFSGGFTGVDIFFVISGYLITSILLQERLAGAYSLVNFYERRARRILPALFAMLFISLPFAWFWLSPTDLKSFSQSLIAICTFSSNIFFYSATGYFDTAAEWKPMLHTWSLAVEEQYYLIFPLCLGVFWKLGRHLLFFILVVLAIASLLLAQWNSTQNIPAGFYLLVSRSWELLLGSIVAFYVSIYNTQPSNKVINQIGSFVGSGLVLYSIFQFNDKIPFPGFYALIPTLGAALIILFSTPETLVSKILGNRLFVAIGLISYSAYLWHWPLFVFARYKVMPEVPSSLLLGGLSILALVFGYLSWKFVERPFRNKTFFSRKFIFISSLLCCIPLLVFGAVGHTTNGYPSRIETQFATTPSIEFPKGSNGWCFFEPDFNAEITVGEQGVQCFLGEKDSSKTALLYGDSIAGNYEPFWDAIGKKSNISVNAITTNYCPSALNGWPGPEWKAKQQCIYNQKFVAENIAKYDLIILAGHWSGLAENGYMDEVFSLIDLASQKNKLVIIMPAPKVFDMNPVEVYNKNLMDKTVFDITKIPTSRDIEQDKSNKNLAEYSRRYKNVFFINRDSLFNINGVSSHVTKDNVPYSFDGLHLSVYGAQSAAANFLESQQYKDFIVMKNKSDLQKIIYKDEGVEASLKNN